ncbi:MBL fold metallo-hydrolase [Adlercreutzia sp. ZJ473]|uniref:MBL fold metallo-hydrolase n=1 Tax=Adlercreutzia sp. ZJ473 TaxID=2722822 RepID=UPI001C12F275|nr:MBL fold metallo-hydrolase [Adlercreutzia sp. ZJ473]
MLLLHVLASGSKGNAAIVEDASTGRGVLVDCGICKRDLFARAAAAGFDLARLDAILITHDHADHVKGLGVATRGLAKARAAAVPPVYALGPVRAASAEIAKVEGACDVRDMRCGASFGIGPVGVHPFHTSHDAAASCGFRFEDADGDALGYVTDTGVLTDEVRDALREVRMLALESNHDERMLREGPYPWALKQRVASDRGHLSNAQAADALLSLLSPRLEQVVGMHLSENNNLPSLAARALTGALAQAEHSARVACAAQHLLVSVR